MAVIEYIEGTEELLKILESSSRFVSSGEIGRAYSRGAINPHGDRYDHYVQDSRWQASVHDGWWDTDEQIAEEAEPYVTEWVEKAHKALVEEDGNDKAVWRFIDFMLEDLRDHAREYPAVKPWSTYVRTRTLWRSWDYETWR